MLHFYKDINELLRYRILLKLPFIEQRKNADIIAYAFAFYVIRCLMPLHLLALVQFYLLTCCLKFKLIFIIGI